MVGYGTKRNTKALDIITRKYEAIIFDKFLFVYAKVVVPIQYC